MFKKLLFGLVICNIALCNISAMESKPKEEAKTVQLSSTRILNYLDGVCPYLKEQNPKFISYEVNKDLCIKYNKVKFKSGKEIPNCAYWRYNDLNAYEYLVCELLINVASNIRGSFYKDNFVKIMDCADLPISKNLEDFLFHLSENKPYGFFITNGNCLAMAKKDFSDFIFGPVYA